MYQREPALERAAGHFFGILSWSETRLYRAKLARTGALLPESPQKPKPSGGTQGAGELLALQGSGGL
jgi:hypothetical protein